jgi:hypothetical protein
MLDIVVANLSLHVPEDWMLNAGTPTMPLPMYLILLRSQWNPKLLEQYVPECCATIPIVLVFQLPKI